MGELVEGPLDAEVGREGERQHDHLGRHVAAGVVADQQHRPVLGHVAHVADLGPVPERRQQPGQRQVLADVVGVAVVEVGASAPAAARRPRAPSALAGRPAAGPERAAARAGDRPPPARATAPSGAQAGRSPRAAAVGAVRRRRCASPARRAWSGQPSGRCLAAQPGSAGVSRRGAGRARATPRCGAGGDCGRAEAIRSPISRLVRLRRARPGARGRSRRGSPGSAPGSASATWREKPGGMSRSLSPQTNSAGGSSAREPGVEAVLAVRLVEVDVASGGEERHPRGARAVDAAELVDGDVGGGRVEPLRVGEQVPELVADERARAAGGGSAASSGRSSRTSGASCAAAEGERRGEQAQRRDPLGRVEADLDRDPAAHRVADQVGALDLHRVQVAAHRGRRTRARRRRPRAGLSEEPKPGRSSAWTV